ncbi:MAG: glycosyltransferase [Muribaculaceae bacterium]|nr:glycosyltransferase [Muribaculaceae bacterium]
MFSLQIPVISWILLGVQILTMIALLIFVLRPLRLIRRLPITCYSEPEGTDTTEEADTEETEETITEETDETIAEEEVETEETGTEEEVETEVKVPKVSVVAYSTVNEDTLTEFLKSVCTQDYPDYEVIVVCDASFEASGILSEKYEELFKRVYVTFIPPGSHNLSRRKLALTIGIKASKGDVVLTTVANAILPSDNWISTMVRPFIENPSIELSLGYSHPDYQEITGPGKYYKEFFALLTDTRWIGYALMHKPYRGDGFNLAFLRETFFRCKGYSKTMHLHSGEDDLFINEIADSLNTAVAISPESILTIRWGETSKRVFNLRRSQYDFTARWLPLGPFVRAGLASTSQWVVLLAGVASALIALPNLIPAIACAVIWLAFIIAESVTYRKASDKLEATRLSWQVPLFWLIKPLNNLYFRAVHRSSRFKNFTWQRHKLS